jgi:L-ascorbate metabolism protein UlaG (beta-lactamase superfamily)
MCIEELESSARVSRRRLFGSGAALGLAATLGSVASIAPIRAQAAAAAQRQAGDAGVNLRCLGTAGWEFTFGNTTILLDPWLTRTVLGGLLGRPSDPTVKMTPNTDLIDQQIQKADIILISHGHYDHTPDIPYIAKKTGARVFGSETHMNLMRALGVPEAQLSTVRGGENMRFDGFSIEVFPSLHGLSATKQILAPHHLITVPSPPPSVSVDFPEGDTLAYQITIADSFRMFAMGTANFVERALSGLQPDLALLAVANYTQTYQYVPRLMNALGNPRLVLPTHWDNWEKPLDQPAVDMHDILGDDGDVNKFMAAVQQVSPATQTVLVDHLQSFAP